VRKSTKRNRRRKSESVLGRRVERDARLKEGTRVGWCCR
jgi:hypothetical protein